MPTTRIGILAPMGLESRPLLDKVRAVETVRLRGLDVRRGSWHGCGVAVAQCGVGKVNAAAAAQALIDAMGCTVLVVCGVAGSVSADLHPGDVLIANRFHQFDVAALRSASWSPLAFTVRSPNGRHSRVLSLEAAPRLLAAARDCASVVTLPAWQTRAPGIRVGAIATGDALVLWPEALRTIASRLGVVAVDMESAAVAQVAYANGVECVAIRGISDRAEELAALNLEGVLALGTGEGSRMKSIVRAGAYVLSHPRGVGGVLGLGRAMRRAAGNAASVADALIASLGSDAR